MRAAQSEHNACSGRTADASDIGQWRSARYGQNDREIGLGRRNSLFAGSEGGADSWAVLASLINTALLNDVDPQAWLTDVLERVVSGQTKSHQLAELLPWNWKTARAAPAQALQMAA